MNPQLIGWGAAGVLAVLGMAWIFLGGEAVSPPDVAAIPPHNDSPEPAAPVPAEEQLSVEPVEVELDSPVAAEFRRLNELLVRQQALSATYPREAVPGRNPEWSWIAMLAAQELPTVRMNWNEPWNAAANDPFVRRRFPAFENPLITAKAGSDRYPASHFVGMTGVGAGAESLSASDARAGIFSQQRATSPQDIADGLANTILLAGVNDQLGSWGRPGRATMRSLEREPYINGPDGFGTGQPDGMFVLMADGSVRFLNSKTEGVVLRRMAAMADGSAIDDPAGGDPFLARSPTSEDTQNPAMDDPGLLVELAPDVPPYNLQRAMQRKIRVFRQNEAVPFEETLLTLQELVGAPIEFSELSEAERSRPVRISAEDVTLRQLVETVMESGGVDFQIGAGRIEVHPR